MACVHAIRRRSSTGHAGEIGCLYLTPLALKTTCSTRHAPATARRSSPCCQERDRVYRYGLRMCRTPEDAQDLAQETMVALARGIGSFRGDAALSTWLYRVARSVCTKRRRRRKGAPEHLEALEDAVDLADPGPTPDEAVARREQERVVNAALAALPDAAREVLLLRDVEGLTAPEVAQALGIGIPAVKSRLHRARLALRDALAPALGPPGPECPDVLAAWSRHLEGDVSPQDCAAMERHLATCPRCAGACDGLRSALGACQKVARGPVPDAVREALQVALTAALGPTTPFRPRAPR